MKIGIVGTGALASLFAHRLAPLAEVTMLGSWQAQIDAVNKRGLTLVELDGTQSTQPVTATSDWHTVDCVDVALVLVKSYQTERAIERIAAVASANTTVVTLQNGIGNLERLAAAFGDERVTAGTSSSGARMVAPGIVQHTGFGRIQLATPPHQAEQLAATLSYLHGANFQVQTVVDAQTVLWGKVAINVGINPLTALLQVPNGHLATDDDARTVMLAAARQTHAIAHAAGITLPYDDAGLATLAVAEATAANHSSMWQDLQRGGRTEIEAICGEVMRTAQRLEVAHHIVKALYDGVVSAESRPQLQQNFDIEQLLTTM